ncbi:MAG: hypothetical protein N2654_03960 [Deltaproteobacteria bacterium]|nr:hypothetical protein [Deltaproteobacteria bacterium]
MRKENEVLKAHIKAFNLPFSATKFWWEFLCKTIYSVTWPVKASLEIPENSVVLTYHSAYLPSLFKLSNKVDKKICLLVRYPRSSFLKKLYAVCQKFFNVEFVYRFNVKKILQASVVVVLLDQDTRVKGIFSSFFGIPAKTPVTIFTLAKSKSSNLYFLKLSRGSFCVAPTLVSISPETLGEFADTYNNLLEQAVREDLTSWCWFHKRWRTRPDKILSHDEYLSFIVNCNSTTSMSALRDSSKSAGVGKTG